MSELTSCNYCNLRNIRKIAKEQNKRVILVASSFMGGTEVFAVPKYVTAAQVREWKGVSESQPNGGYMYRKYHVSWMMEIPSQCCC